MLLREGGMYGTGPSLKQACFLSPFSSCHESGHLETADPLLPCLVASVFILSGKCHFWFSSYLNPLGLGCLRNHEVSWTKKHKDVFQLFTFCPGTGKCFSLKWRGFLNRFWYADLICSLLQSASLGGTVHSSGILNLWSHPPSADWLPGKVTAHHCGLLKAKKHRG